jgi:hypothetical protein
MSAEDRASENMAPVGREFGSPDYERLAQEDLEQVQANLARLILKCSRTSGTVPESTTFRTDTINVQVALRELGHEVDLDTAARVWRTIPILCVQAGCQVRNPESLREFALRSIAGHPLKILLVRVDGPFPDSQVVASDDLSRRVAVTSPQKPS